MIEFIDLHCVSCITLITLLAMLCIYGVGVNCQINLLTNGSTVSTDGFIQ